MRVFASMAALSLLPLLIVKYPPMVDLPQHAAQIRLWQDLDDHADTHKLNPLTPYLATYLAGRALAEVFPIRAAMKVLVAVLILALPLALVHLLVRTGGDRWWALLGFPLSYSFCFYWGLLNFLAAAPLGIVLVTLALDLRRSFDGGRHGLGREVVLALLALALLATHGLVCAFALLVAGTATLLAAGSVRTAVLRQLAFLPAAAGGLWWYLATRSAEEQTSKPFTWDFRWSRFAELPGTLLGDPGGRQAALFGAAMLVLVLLALRRPAAGPAPARLRLARAVPFVLALGVFLFAPDIYFRAAFFNLRFAVFLVPWLLLAVVPGRPADRLSRTLVAVLAAAWLVALIPRFLAFDREAREIDGPLAAMEPDRRVLGLVFEPFSAAVPAPAHLHLFAWYAAEKGGIADFSFAYFYPQLVRYRPDVEPLVPDAFSWRPQTFDDRLRSSYDYFLVRSSTDRTAELFPSHRPPAVRLRVHSGKWWLYEVQAGTFSRSE